MSDLENIRLHPLGSVILVLPKAAERPATESGIVLADVQYEPETCGLIVKMGTHFYCRGCGEDRPPALQVGQWVIFPRQAGTVVPLDEREYLLLQEHEVLAVVDEPEAVEVV